LRLKAILSLLALQGLREIEIIRLDVKDIDYPSRVAHVRGKGHDDKEPVSLHLNSTRELDKGTLGNYLTYLLSRIISQIRMEISRQLIGGHGIPMVAHEVGVTTSVLSKMMKKNSQKVD